MLDHRPNPSGRQPGASFAVTNSPRAAFLDLLANTESLCHPPPVELQHVFLRFKAGEVLAINEILKRFGVPHVMKGWGHERRCNPSDLRATYEKELQGGSARRSARSVGDDKFLRVSEFGIDPKPTQEMLSYYRSAPIRLQEMEEHLLLMNLRTSGLTALMVPARDTFLKLDLHGSEIAGLHNAIEVFGPRFPKRTDTPLQLFGPRSPTDNCIVLSTSIELKLLEGHTLFARLRVDSTGAASTRLWDPRLQDSSYEGHQIAPIDLSRDQYKILAQFLQTQVTKGIPPVPPFLRAEWQTDLSEL